jgi:hypothetical protein
MTRFRIAESDIVKATASGNRRLIASLYDSGFTTIQGVISSLNRKIPYYGGNRIEYNITIPEKMKSIYVTRKVN